jgi:hypothetical protein
MKKSAKVTLTVVAAVGLAGCGRRRMDPCQASSFDEQACQDAVRSGGYYWGGTWVPMRYGNPYPYYYDSYRSYTSRGGRVVTAPSNSYSRPAAGSGNPGSSTSHGVSRGGFGSVGAGHSSGA